MTRIRRIRTDGVQSPLETYLREINTVPLLSSREERELAYQIAEGNREARERMVCANLRLVVRIARGYAGRGLGLLDLIAEGNLGLLRAVEGFDPTLDTRFSTYASYWIKQSIRRALVNTSKTIRIPAYLVVLLAKYRRAALKLQDELGRPPTPEEIGRSLDLSKKRLGLIRKALRTCRCSPPDDQNRSGWSLDELLLEANHQEPDADIGKADRLQLALELLDHLDPRKAQVVRMRFGLGADKPKTLKEIGEWLGLTRERVRQLESEALSKLGKTLDAERATAPLMGKENRD
jgi:RNA polymerase primary sigma factor